MIPRPWQGPILAWTALQARVVFGRIRVVRTLPAGPWPSAHVRESLVLQVGDGIDLQGWAARLAVGGDHAASRVLVYFGGRNEHVVWAPHMASYLGPAWTVYAFNYRGRGGSGGRVSEALAKHDARLILDEVIRREGGRPATLALMGRSLGTAVALSAAHLVQPDRLVLLSPFENLPSLLATWPLMVACLRAVWTQTFDCVGDARAVPASTLVVLAERDERIPHAHSRRLAACLRGLHGVVVTPGTTHRTLPRHPDTQLTLAAFLNRAT